MKLSFRPSQAFTSFTAILFTIFVFGQKDLRLSMVELGSELSKIGEIGLIKGYGVAIVSKDSTLFARGFGYSDVQNQSPYTRNSI